VIQLLHVTVLIIGSTFLTAHI